MPPVSAAVKIYYCRTPINLHKSFDGPPGAVRQYLEADPSNGRLLVFFNRTFKMVKILYRDKDGCAAAGGFLKLSGDLYALEREAEPRSEAKD